MLWPFSVVELRLGRDLVLREGVHRHLRDRDPAGEGAGTGLELRGWRSCSGAGSLEADTGPGDIAKPDTVEDTVTVRTVMEEDIGRRDPDPGEEDRKLAGTDKQPVPRRSKAGRDPGGLDHDHDRWDPTWLSKTR